MIVHCANFGSLWWLRPGLDVSSAKRFTSEAAIFNTTGFKPGSNERRNWTVPGVIRLNAGTCIAQGMNLREVPPGNFETPGIEHKVSQNRLLLFRRAKETTRADMILAVVRSDNMGRIDFDSAWRTPGVRIVAASAYNSIQETLLLIPVNGEVSTTNGRWGIEWQGTRKIAASLKMIG